MIYVHVPFCRRRCNYCAFNSTVGDETQRAAYVDALITEINLRGDNSSVETIYFGGGTPTTLTLNQLARIVNAIGNGFDIDAGAEITIEANPGTVDADYLRGLRSLGFNRLSLGVQTFDDALLKFLGRIHSSRAAIETVELAKKFFGNVSVDLMYGLPNQTLNGVRRDVTQVGGLDVEHVSIYGLEVEVGTKFFALNAAGQLPLPDDDICADMYDFITLELPALGFRRYEISNFARGNFVSRHNIGYWTGKRYFGFGAGAHGFDGALRTSNVRGVDEYISRISAGMSVAQVEEVVDKRAAMEEFCFLGLRMVDGISARTFAKTFGTEIFAVFGDVIEHNRRRGLLNVVGDRISLTNRGMSLGNVVFADFLL